MKQNRIDKYLNAVEEALKNTILPEEFWPLKPAQMTAYFEDILAVDIFKKIQVLKKRKVNLKKVTKLFFTPSILRNFLLNYASTGLKVAHNFSLFKTNFKEREEFFNYLFNTLEKMVESDIFMADKKQIILNKKEVQKIPWRAFIKLDEKSRKVIKRFNLALFSLTWSLFFDAFYATGFNSHGPYWVPKKFGNRKSLVINDYFNLHPIEIWPKARNTPFKQIRIYNIYKDITWRINFFGREDPRINLGSNLNFALVEIDGKIIRDLSQIESLTENIFKITERQTNFVNNLTPLEQVKKGAEISYFGLRDLFIYFNDDWRPPKQIDEVIQKFGEEFIKKFDVAIVSQKPKKEIRKIFDPRNNQN